jgi:Na+/H+ antiporter NhaD/arsenite permease-like protein
MNPLSKQPALPLLGMLVALPSAALADAETSPLPLDLTHHWAGYFSLVVMVLAYVAAMLEEVTHMRKSKPMLFGAALVWFAISLVYRQQGQVDAAVTAFTSNLLAYIELLLFIMVSMTYLNAMEDMGVFNGLRIALVRLHLGYRALFWVTGILVFFISCVVNGLTAGLLMGVVVIAVGRDCPRFVSLASINIVVATNAGGSFSPLGGISTLFVWQKGMLEFTQFFTLFVPSLVNFLVPALAMHFAVPSGKPRDAAGGAGG